MTVRDFIGGSPWAVVVRLVILSVIVGLLLSVFGITPRNLYYVLDEFFRSIYDMGFGAVRWFVDYLVLGAMVVLPIWILVRILRSGSRSE